MSYDMQASGTNSVGSLTSLDANNGWSDTPNNPVFRAAGFTPNVGNKTITLDAVLGWGNGAGAGVIGAGGFSGGTGPEGSGVIGIPGSAIDNLGSGIRGKNVGVYGAAAGTNPAIGVL